MGDRPRGRTSVNRTSHPPAAQGGGRSHGAELPCGQAAAQQTAAQRRLLDRGKPRNEDTEDGNQSADKSLINRRLKLRPQACAVLALPRAGRDLAAAPANYCSSLTTDIRLTFHTDRHPRAGQAQLTKVWAFDTAA